MRFDDSFILAGDIELVDEVFANMKTTIFPSYTKDAIVASLAINGSGSIDNLTIDATASEIAITAPTSDVWEASDLSKAKGNPGDTVTMTLTITDTAYLFADGTSVKTGVAATVDANGVAQIDDESAIETLPVLVGVACDDAEFYKDYINLEEALAKVAELTTTYYVEVTIKADCATTDDLCRFVKDDFIMIDADSNWTIEGAEVTFLTGLENRKIVDATAVESFTFGGLMKPGAQLTAGEITTDENYPIVLAINDGEGSAKITASNADLAVTAEDTEAYEVEKIENEDGTFTYQLKAITTEVLPTATVNKTEADGYEVAVQFDAGELGTGYENWTAEFVLTSDVAIGADEIQLGGSYAAYEEGKWIDIAFPGCEADEEISVLGLVDYNDITVKTVFDVIQSFKCGVKNIGLKSDATFTLKLVITDGETTKEICSIGELKVAAKATEPQVVPEEQGTVEFVGEDDNRIAKVTPKEGVTEITVNPPTGFMGKYEIPVSITKITGVEISQLIIKSGEYDIAPACKLVEGVIELNEAATVTVGSEEIPVKPVLSDATDEVKPLVVGETTAVGVKAIPGLKYSLVRSVTIGGEQKAVASETATDARVTLTDNFDGGKPASAFYVIQVTK